MAPLFLVKGFGGASPVRGRRHGGQRAAGKDADRLDRRHPVPAAVAPVPRRPVSRAQGAPPRSPAGTGRLFKNTLTKMGQVLG